MDGHRRRDAGRALPLAFAFTLAGCTRAPAEPASRPARTPCVVFAAASLTNAFTALGAAFEEREPSVAVRFVFEGSPSLVLKLRQGAHADVLATADRVHMDEVVAAGLTLAPPVDFACNRLAIVVQKGNPKGLRTLGDLARPELRVALCGPTVPAGRYAREALAKAGITLRSLSDETSVTALCGKVRLGELDAAVAYVTDAKMHGLEAIGLEAAHDVTARYPIAVLAPGAERFVEFVRGDAGRRILAAHGFALP